MDRIASPHDTPGLSRRLSRRGTERLPAVRAQKLGRALDGAPALAPRGFVRGTQRVDEPTVRTLLQQTSTGEPIIMAGERPDLRDRIARGVPASPKVLLGGKSKAKHPNPAAR
jgi:hypothetical protein